MADKETFCPALSIDACFYTPCANGLDYPKAQRSVALLNHLAHQVVRQRGDLVLHARRIRLAAMLGQQAELAEALADLFIVLGNKGSDLRARALRDWGHALPKALSGLFEEAFANGLDADMAFPLRCRLTRGNLGRKSVIEPLAGSDADATPWQDEGSKMLETVRDMVDSGMFAEACTMLERWLPDAEEVYWQEGAIELIRLYRGIEDGEARARAWWTVLCQARQDRALAWAALLERKVAA